jgi:hypothetical protein
MGRADGHIISTRRGIDYAGEEYAMTEEDKNSAIDKAAREHAEASKTIAMLRARLREIGQQYRKVAEAMQNEPEGLVATEEAMDSRFAYKIVSIQLGSWVAIKDVLDLTRQLREAIIRESDSN